MPLTNQGYDAKRAADWLEQIRNAYENETGLTINWDRDEFLAQITAIMATRLGELSESAQGLYDVFDPDNATGVYLEVLCSLSGITRRSATASTVDMTLYGDSNTTVPAGSQVEDPNGVIWESDSDATIGSGGTVTTQFTATETGSITLIAGEVDTANGKGRIVTPVSGWDDAKNKVDATPGRDRETDPELRARRKESLQVVGAASVNAIRSSLEKDVDPVTSARVLHNPTDNVLPINGSSVDQDPHTVSPVVYPSSAPDMTTSEYKQAIADSLAASVSAGIGMNGDVTESVTLEKSNNIQCYWQWANSVLINAEVVVSLNPGYTLTTELENEIQDIVADYMANLDVSEDVERLPVLGDLARLDELSSAEVRYAEDPNAPADQDITIDLIEIADLNGSANVHT